MAAAIEKAWMLDGWGLPLEFDGVVDTSDYVLDEEAVKTAMEMNRAMIASYG